MVKVLLAGPEIGSHTNRRTISIVGKSVDSFRNQAMGRLGIQGDLFKENNEGKNDSESRYFQDDKQFDLFPRVQEVEMKKDSYDKLTSMPLPLFDELIGIILSNPNLKSEEVDELLEIVEVSLENNNGTYSSKLIRGGNSIDNSGIIVKMTRRDFSKLEMISENDFRQAVNIILSVPGISIKKINELLKNKKIETHHIQAAAA